MRVSSSVCPRFGPRTVVARYLAWLPVLGLLAFGCGQREGDVAQADSSGTSDREVVVYTALDQIYSEPILKRFEARSGIRVRAVYDTEAAKTTGLVSRLIAERKRPRCDVFWNNEIIRTMHLKDRGLLQAFDVPNAEGIPAAFKDPEGHWVGLAARARVVAYNTERVTAEQAPKTMQDLLDPEWRGRLGMAYPLFGTTSTHAAALFSEWGRDRAEGFFESLEEAGVIILDGNMTACRAVAEGELDICLTDTDDVNLLKSQGHPVERVLLDHAGQGALLVPNTLCLIAGAPNPEAGRELIDYLLSPEVEARLAASPSAQIPLRPGVQAPPEVQRLAEGPFWQVDYAAASREIEPSAEFLRKLFARP